MNIEDESSGIEFSAKRKRKFDEANESDHGPESTPKVTTKVARTTDINASPSPVSTTVCASECHSIPTVNGQYFISLESMTVIKNHLSKLNKKNQETKASMQLMRDGVVKDLLSHMRVRQMAIGHLGRFNLEDDMRELCLSALDNRKVHLCSKEQELVCLERLLGGHDAVLELANAACMELDEKINAQIERLARGDSLGLFITEFPRMLRLARLTGGIESITTHSISNSSLQVQNIAMSQESFTVFNGLPTEIRLQVWEASFPGPRILTEHSRHNKLLTTLATCRESRNFAQSRYSRILSPSRIFPLNPTPILYINPEIDTVVRDLTTRNTTDNSLFTLESPAFNWECYQMLIGLSQVKHLALAFDLLRENGGTLFGSVQACCPRLETLTIFPSSQIGSPKSHNYRLRFVELDSNLMDFVSFRWEGRFSDRKTKRKALRGLAVIATLSSHALQYKAVFPEYVELYGQQWNPMIKVCLLVRWSRRYQGWQSRPLDGDRYSKGFPAEDGKLHKGFVESGVIGDLEGLYSRYDGMQQLFAEEEGN